MLVKIKLIIAALRKFFNETASGRTIKRFLKTFAYAFVATYVAIKTGPFQADWKFILEAALLAGAGFGADKGIRDLLRADKE